MDIRPDWPLPLLFALLLLSACSGLSEGPPVVEVSDSAGVEIVLNPPAQAAELVGITLSSIPTLQIGGPGEEEYEFFRIRSVVGLSDDGIAVADGMSREISVFDSVGTFLYSVGGRGDGPGEFRTLSWISRAEGDSLFAYDGAAKRISLFPPGQEAARISVTTFPIDPPPLGTAPEGTLVSGPGAIYSRLSDGRYLMAGAVHLLSGGGAGFRRLPVALLLADPLLSRVDTLATISASDFYETGTAEFPGYRPVPMGRRFAMVGNRDRVFVTEGGEYRIDLFGLDGTILRSIREGMSPRPVRDENKAAYLESLGDRRPEDPWTLPFPEFLPTFSNLLVDDLGRLWAKEYQAPGEPAETWHLFDAAGHLRSVVKAPAGFAIHEVGDGRVIGVRQDSLGVETVEIHALIEPHGAL